MEDHRYYRVIGGKRILEERKLVFLSGKEVDVTGWPEWKVGLRIWWITPVFAAVMGLIVLADWLI